MTRVPFAARVAAGVAVTVVEEARKLPKTTVMFPMTVVSEVLASSMRFQQQVTALAIKGDQVFASLPLVGTPDQEQPSWAVFEEDTAGTEGDVDIPDHDSPDRDAPPASGRFALYSTPPAESSAATATKAAPADTADRPDIIDLVDYDTLALAQLRARLRTLSLDDLETLREYESDSLHRAPFLTMLENRITTAKAK